MSRTNTRGAGAAPPSSWHGARGWTNSMSRQEPQLTAGAFGRFRPAVRSHPWFPAVNTRHTPSSKSLWLIPLAYDHCLLI
jgi:hypothetical protein